MGRGGGEMRELDRAGVETGRHKTGDVGHVHHQEGANLVRDCPEPGKVDGAGIGRSAGDDDFGLRFVGLAGKLFVVDHLRFLVDAVGDDVVEPAGE